jgi:ribosomal protein S18 acetylase RimI-like enzyme
MTIRKYQTEDREKLIALWQQVFPDDPPHNEPSAVLDAKLAVDDLIFVVEDKGDIIGTCMAGYDGHRGWLYAVAVSPDHRRSGIGKELVAKTIQAMQALGCIKVNLQIRADNTAVAEFYKSLGFSVEDRMSMGVLMT